MAYTTSLLTTAAECDELLDDARDEKRSLDRRIYNRQYTAEDSADAATERTAALAVAEAEVTTLTNVVASLPDGDYKKKQQRALRTATYRRDSLADATTGGPVATLSRQLDLAQAQAELAEVTAFIAAVEERKAAL